ncbi:MAG: protein kinase [Oscillospiraceae bacterium]|nr:protein kinase [Oscillospiraceae bacterium]
MENNLAMLPGWKIVRELGHGSFGAVYEIERKIFKNTEKAALKVICIPRDKAEIEDLRRDDYDDASITAIFEDQLQGILDEYMLMRKLNGNTNVVNCDDVIQVQHDDGFGWDVYIKMELLTPLKEALPRTPTEEQVIRIGSDMCNALGLCEVHHIIHRDIKPENIFVSPYGAYKLGDFGVSRTMERTTMGTKTGTYNYMAPEIYNNREYNHTADIYSLGMVLYWLLNERRGPFLPLPPKIARATEHEMARTRRFRGDALPAPKYGSDALKAVVLKACAFDPKDRYQSAKDMKKALDVLLAAYEMTETETGSETVTVDTVRAEKQTPSPKAIAPVAEHTVVEATERSSAEQKKQELPKSEKKAEPPKEEKKQELPKPEKKTEAPKVEKKQEPVQRKKSAASPEPKQTEPQKQEQKPVEKVPDKKRKPKGIFALVALLVLVIAAATVLGRGGDSDSASNPTDAPQPTVSVTPTAVPTPTLQPNPSNSDEAYFSLTLFDASDGVEPGDNGIENMVSFTLNDIFFEDYGEITGYSLYAPDETPYPNHYVTVMWSSDGIYIQPTEMLPYGTYCVDFTGTKDNFDVYVVYGLPDERYHYGITFDDPLDEYFGKAYHEQTGVALTPELLEEYGIDWSENFKYDMYEERGRDFEDGRPIVFKNDMGYLAYGNDGLYFSETLTDACWWMEKWG